MAEREGILTQAIIHEGLKHTNMGLGVMGVRLGIEAASKDIVEALKKMSKARYGSVLAKEVDCTYSHAVKILQTLESLQLVGFEKKGRINLIKLTKKGEEISEYIDNIRRKL